MKETKFNKHTGHVELFQNKTEVFVFYVLSVMAIILFFFWAVIVHYAIHEWFIV